MIAGVERRFFVGDDLKTACLDRASRQNPVDAAFYAVIVGTLEVVF
jgi:hypothetical protein